MQILTYDNNLGVRQAKSKIQDIEMEYLRIMKREIR